MTFRFLFGYKGKYPRVIFTSGSLKFLEGLAKNLSEIIQIPVKVAYSQIQNSGNLCYHLQYNTNISKIILEFMYKDLKESSYLERKYAIYQKYLQLNK